MTCFDRRMSPVWGLEYEGPVTDWVLTGPGRPHALSGERETVVGRAPGCDLVLDYPSVSRRHAVLRVLSGVPRIEDAASRYGTLVNGAPILGETVLFHGDHLQIGSVCLVLQDCGRVSRTARSTVAVGLPAPPDVRPTAQTDPVEGLVGSLEQCLAAGDLDGIAWRAETLIGIWRTRVSIDPALLDRAAVALLAGVTPTRASWIDSIVELHYAGGLAMSSGTLARLDAAVAVAPSIDWAAVAIYADSLRARGIEQPTPERAEACVAGLSALARRSRR